MVVFFFVAEKMDSLFASASKDLALKEQKAITEEISNNYYQLEQAKSAGLSASDASYSHKEIVKDFRGKEHKEPDTYLRSIALDKNIADKIDYASDMGSKIKEIAEKWKIFLQWIKLIKYYDIKLYEWINKVNME